MAALATYCTTNPRPRSKLLPEPTIFTKPTNIMFNFLKRLFGGGESINLAEMLAQGAIVLDVRSKEEFMAGHPAGAQNVPLPELDRQLLKIINQKKTVITCCVSGRRSGIAAQQLKAAGVQAVNGGPWQNVASAINKNKQATSAA